MTKTKWIEVKIPKSKDLYYNLAKAWKMAEEYNEGSIVIQYLKNKKYLVTYQMDNTSFPDVGGGWYGSEDRIVLRLDCRDYEKMYWEGKKEIERNRLGPEEYDDIGGYWDLANQVMESVNELDNKDMEELEE